MCMATFIPRNSEIPFHGIYSGADINDDGHGWAIAADTGVILSGHSMNAEEALEGLYEARKGTGKAPALFHSRFATHGAKVLENCHPFMCGEDSIMAHNGILPKPFLPSPWDERSDTRVLAEDYMSRLSPLETYSRRERKYLASVIGSYNKLVILSVSPNLPNGPRGFIVNASSGVFTDGVWFSNHDYEGWTRWTRTNGTTKVTLIEPAERDPQGFLESCPVCDSLDLDAMANVCRRCDTCLDCAEWMGDCMCYVPQSARRPFKAEGEGWVMG